MSKEVVLSLKNICKDYMQGRSLIEVLKNVNLEVMESEIIAIIGASGSGKSTLLHIAGLLDKANSGSVSIKGVDTKKLNNFQYAHEIRLSKIGFIYQYHHLLGDFNARMNVAMPLLIAGEHKNIALEKADELLNSLGLGKRLCNLPGELSGGEVQRVAIARALINNPEIILADEPTGNLDGSTAEMVFEMFIEQARKHNTAIIMVTHNMDLAKRMDKQYKLHNSNVSLG